MPHTVITIARQLGSGGDILGHKLAGQLGVPLLAQEVLELAAQQAAVSLDTLEAAEQVPSWTERLLDSIGRSLNVEPFGGPLTPSTLELMMVSSDYRRMIPQVVRGLADRGPCVIVGHASQIALRETPGVLHVYVHASPALRAMWVAGERKIPLDEAARLIHRDDEQRLAFFRTYYDVRWNDPELYGLAINTGILDLDLAAELVQQAALRLGRVG